MRARCRPARPRRRAGAALRAGRAPDAARRDRRLRGVPLQHDGRQAHGAGQHAVPLPRHGGRRRGRLGRGDPAAAADAGAGRAAHHRGAVVAPPGRGRRAVVARSTSSRWPEVDAAATAEATREVPVQVNGKLRDRIVVADRARPARLEAAALAAPKIAALLAGRDARPVIQAGGGRLVNIVLRDADRPPGRRGVAAWAAGVVRRRRVRRSTTPRSGRGWRRDRPRRRSTGETVRAVCMLRSASSSGLRGARMPSRSRRRCSIRGPVPAIVADDVPVGFVMLSMDPRPPSTTSGFYDRRGARARGSAGGHRGDRRPRPDAARRDGAARQLGPGRAVRSRSIAASASSRPARSTRARSWAPPALRSR